jgi:hypothetical protein
MKPCPVCGKQPTLVSTGNGRYRWACVQNNLSHFMARDGDGDTWDAAASGVVSAAADGISSVISTCVGGPG